MPIIFIIHERFILNQYRFSNLKIHWKSTIIVGKFRKECKYNHVKYGPSPLYPFGSDGCHPLPIDFFSQVVCPSFLLRRHHRWWRCTAYSRSDVRWWCWFLGSSSQVLHWWESSCPQVLFGARLARRLRGILGIDGAARPGVWWCRWRLVQVQMAHNLCQHAQPHAQSCKPSIALLHS